MNVYKLVGHNVEVTDAMRNYVHDRLDKLERFSHQVVDAKVVLHVKASSESSRSHRVEVQLNVPHGIIRAEEARGDMYQAIDAAANTLERQLKKFKDRFLGKNIRKHGDTMPVPTEIEPEDEEFLPEIVRSKRFELRPMTSEDAAAQMEALGHDFFVFENARSRHVNVIYRRKDGHYGLIEPNND